MKYDVKYYDYIAQETQVHVIQAKDEAEAIVIAHALSPNRNFTFDPSDYSASERLDEPYITTKYDALKEMSESCFDELYNKALEYIEEE